MIEEQKSPGRDGVKEGSARRSLRGRRAAGWRRTDGGGSKLVLHRQIVLWADREDLRHHDISSVRATASVVRDIFSGKRMRNQRGGADGGGAE